MIRHKLSIVLSLVAALILPISVISLASAATPNTGNGLKISPVVTNLTINPGQTQTVGVHVQNVTNAPVTLQVFINDFTTTDESGTPALLLSPNQYAPSHSLKRFITPINNISLQAGEDKGVNVVIAVPKDASGGGYYGAVRFAPASSSGRDNITLSASVGSLILVRVPGSIKEDMQLASLDVRDGQSGSPRILFTSGKGIVMAARFQNAGDVQEQPFGKILLKSSNKQVASYEINDITPPGNVLPGSIRKFTVNLDRVGSFGKYTVIGNFGYGTNGQLLSGQTTFYVVPIPAIMIALGVVLFILFCILVLPKLVRRYNQRVVQRATHRR